MTGYEQPIIDDPDALEAIGAYDQAEAIRLEADRLMQERWDTERRMQEVCAEPGCAAAIEPWMYLCKPHWSKASPERREDLKNGMSAGDR